jgi:hypothetical protein
VCSNNEPSPQNGVTDVLLTPVPTKSTKRKRRRDANDIDEEEDEAEEAAADALAAAELDGFIADDDDITEEDEELATLDITENASSDVDDDVAGIDPSLIIPTEDGGRPRRNRRPVQRFVHPDEAKIIERDFLKRYGMTKEEYYKELSGEGISSDDDKETNSAAGDNEDDESFAPSEIDDDDEEEEEEDEDEEGDEETNNA